MAPVKPTSDNGFAPTRPRLQSINQDFSNLDGQLRQAAHIIGLPDNWITIEEGEVRSSIIRRLVRARAEWVLRWVLEKLKEETDAGKTTRGNATAWKLLDWMMHVLPVSRSAPHLRDAGFPSILERTLLENFDKDSNLLSASTSEEVRMKDASEPSETIREETQPSRKRKRGTVDTTPLKRAALASTHREQLFHVVSSAVASIVTLATASSKSDDTTQSELMKMVLRTESAQASRILRFWCTAVHQIIITSTVLEPDMHRYLDLSLALEIWQLRIVDSKDEAGASADDFSAECLVPILMLLDCLRTARRSDPALSSSTAINRATQAIDKLLARHLFAPSRAAFFADTTSEAANPGSKVREAKALASYLEPLRARLLQAAQIEDAGDSLPAELASLFNAVPYLLDLAIRTSPSRTPKGRLAEKPWIQAAFRSLAECAGCSLNAPPKDVTRQTAVNALAGAIRTLQLHSVSIDSETLLNLFWYHCGVKYPEHREKEVHWSLIASLIELDPLVFVTEPKNNLKTTQKQQTDLAEIIFDQISVVEFKGAGFADDALLGNADVEKDHNPVGHPASHRTGRTVILGQIIVPLMSAFARSRNLLGFLRRWDHQLVRSYRHDNRKALKERTDPIWEDRAINKALVGLFEQSLTQGQIATLIQEHAKRMVDLGKGLETESKEDVNVKRLAAYKNSASSAVLIPAMLQSIQSDETIDSLKSHLHSLLLSYATWVQVDRYSLHSRLAFSWFTLCQLLSKLWPVELHSSVGMQKELIYPLVEQATKDMSLARKDQYGRRVDSLTRAAAMLFLLDACDHLQTVPGSESLIQTSLSKIMQSLSSSRLEPKEYAKMIGFFCADFVTLFGHLDADACGESLKTLLLRLSKFENEDSSLIVSSLSQSIIEEGNSALKNAYYTALLEILSENTKGRQHEMVIKAFLHTQPSAFPRGKREATLDRLTELLTLQPHATTDLLSVMAHLMVVPNATTKLCIDGGIIFRIADELHKQGQASPAALQLFQQLVQSTLGHIIPNQDQAQNNSFLDEFAGMLNSITKVAKQCSAARLSIMRATILVQKQIELLDMERYVELLQQCLVDEGNDTAPLEHVLDAFNEIPTSVLGKAGCLAETQAWLRKWVKDNSELDSYISSSGQSPTELASYVVRLHKTVARFQLYPSAKWLIELTLRLLQERIASGNSPIFETLKDTLASLSTQEQLGLIPILTDVVNPHDRAASYRILNDLITTWDDRVEEDAGLKQKQLALLPRICVLLADSSDHEAFNALLSSINTILNDKPSFASQYSIECVLSVLVKLTSRSSPALAAQHAPEIFSRLCETSRLILLVHRGRLGGRFHLLLPLLQGLLFCLFIPNASRSGALPTWLRTITGTDPVRLTPANSNQYSRLLSTLCNPPQSSITRAHHYQSSRKSKDLNDPVKAARERASHFLYPLLASFCRFQLNGRLEAGVREKLMVGIYEVIGTASLHKEALDAMFAGLGRSERDVWRGLWGEWEGVHGRRQVVGHGE
ncbi:Nn.00g104330.m01.CDS01 [Neocucurbitaria sp. VM-36]